ncbi:endothelial cell-specific chemotaxis regulator isoform X2 [Microcaecilia unicolor]|uniref:Endothelial cell-specific chemotaxis regulator isoform X2 n=1 Tax=Microcaecilia unicolor TaxID=1415580 RepID=A0A6P7YRN3_9AMPH|nr:endothelial cell-specific chemotaxis regulator isoform X2 [Microcaecilia unicolor]
MECVTKSYLLWIFFWAMMKDGACTAENVSFSSPPGIPQNNIPVSPTYMNQTEPLTVAAFGGIIFIAILITGVIVLLFVVTLRFKCKTSSDTEVKAKSEGHVLTESSVSTGELGSITLISMRNLNLAMLR